MNTSSENFVDYCTEERDSLVDVPNAFPYIHCLETEKGGYLIRQYLYSSLYDRIRCITLSYE
jgi:phosphoinositide-3-kinase regulatory subunit 4